MNSYSVSAKNLNPGNQRNSLLQLFIQGVRTARKAAAARQEPDPCGWDGPSLSRSVKGFLCRCGAMPPAPSSASLPEHGWCSKAKNAARRWLHEGFECNCQMGLGHFSSYLFEEWTAVILCTCKQIACLFLPRQEFLRNQVEPTSWKQPFISKNRKRSSFLRA